MWGDAGHRHGRARRPRQILARPGAHRDRSRPLRRGEAPRADDRSRLCPCRHRRRGDQLRRRAGTRPVPAQHAGRRRRRRRLPVRRCRHRGLEAAERGAPADPRAGRSPARRRGPDQGRPARRQRAGGAGLPRGRRPARRHVPRRGASGARGRAGGRRCRPARGGARRPRPHDARSARPRPVASVDRPCLLRAWKRDGRHRDAHRRLDGDRRPGRRRAGRPAGQGARDPDHRHRRRRDRTWSPCGAQPRRRRTQRRGPWARRRRHRPLADGGAPRRLADRADQPRSRRLPAWRLPRLHRFGRARRTPARARPGVPVAGRDGCRATAPPHRAAAAAGRPVRAARDRARGDRRRGRGARHRTDAAGLAGSTRTDPSTASSPSGDGSTPTSWSC